MIHKKINSIEEFVKNRTEKRIDMTKSKEEIWADGYDEGKLVAREEFEKAFLSKEKTLGKEIERQKEIIDNYDKRAELLLKSVIETAEISEHQKIIGIIRQKINSCLNKDGILLPDKFNKLLEEIGDKR